MLLIKEGITTSRSTPLSSLVRPKHIISILPDETKSISRIKLVDKPFKQAKLLPPNKPDVIQGSSLLLKMGDKSAGRSVAPLIR
jgi:hypothetical protein